MGRISDDDIRRVRDATDLVSLVSERVVLKQKGRLQWGCCPFHAEKTPSFKVDPATQLWHCFGCGLGGDAYGFLMRTENVEFGDAVRVLADRARIEITEEAGGVPRGHKERLMAASEAAAAFYHDYLTKSAEAGAAKAREYLSKRGFGSTVAKRWSLGYAPGRGVLVRHLADAGYTSDEIVSANLGLASDGGQVRDRFYERIMFPIHDLQGRSIGFGGRVIEPKEPKYLNTQDTPIFHKSANMYAIDVAKATITSTGIALVVEGYTDVIALHEAGITNAVATLGTALTREHVKLLSRFAKRVVYLFDGDAAGLRAADRAAEFIDRSATPEAGKGRVELEVAVIPDGLDPADYVSTHGAEGLNAVVASSVPLLRFSIDRRLERWDLDRPEERVRALQEAAEVLAPVKGSILADDYANYIADRLFVDFETAKRAISAVRSGPGSEATTHEESHPGTKPPVLQPGDARQLRAERDLIDLYVRSGRLRSRARYLLDEDLLTDERHRAMAEVIAQVGPEMSPADVVGELGLRVPGSAEALAGAELDGLGEGDYDQVEADVVRTLKEMALERRIRVESAWLNQNRSLKDTNEYDEVFRKVSVLQRQLAVLRSGAR
ncbi:MAG: DNA primase [Coriobacteriia bacterium]|nr:DNA primase [Coriobacteriia bacterium]